MLLKRDFKGYVLGNWRLDGSSGIEIPGSIPNQFPILESEGRNEFCGFSY